MNTRSRPPSIDLTLLLPFLVAVAPILWLWSRNAAIVGPSDVAAHIGLVALATLSAVGILLLVTRAPRRSALTVALVWLPILTYGYQLGAARAQFPEVVDGLEEAVTLLNVLSLVAALLLVWRRPVGRVAEFATVGAAIFCLSTLPGIVAELDLGPPPTRSGGVGDASGPDIYWIVLDGYAREDVLRMPYDFDNGTFIDGLRSRGFYVADESYSNYAMTYLSLAGTLNMEYLDPPVSHDYAAVDRLIEDGAAIHALQRFGYRYVHLETEWWATADAPLADVALGRGRFETEFDRVLFETTLLGTVMPPRPRHESVLNAFEDLASVADMPESTFTFGHLLVPHPPFMFAADGEVLPYSDDLAAEFKRDPYVEQLSFVNAEVMALVDAIVERSDTPPVIVIQGDHGPAAFLTDFATREEIYRERHGILNAMLVPDAVAELLHPGISPVNTFRVLLQGLFGAELPVLPDRAFYNWYFNGNHAAIEGNSLELREITDELP